MKTAFLETIRKRSVELIQITDVHITEDTQVPFCLLVVYDINHSQVRLFERIDTKKGRHMYDTLKKALIETSHSYVSINTITETIELY